MKEKHRIAEEELNRPRSKYEWNTASDFDEKLSAKFGAILYR